MTPALEVIVALSLLAVTAGLLLGVVTLAHCRHPATVASDLDLDDDRDLLP